ncbi:peptide chain release factor N(5)-glutamine methyltransferase [Colwellia psychrerythraea]|uniref:Release factor glutamine methyltransferase n=1 Tax=Colwellia psychrerythraea TaxID=28229 RepID=A0A099KQE2_COLPS|nr:peptide chain release factor N(5)-glutamine methyltransferase [Colwellia psychrerythraea]KGJ92984.1 Protein-(glutamine-N5) methyltransferase, release factor-specific [Colwellia psychrerythraea]
MSVIPPKNATIDNLIAIGQEQLTSCSDSAKLDAQILLAFVLEKELSYLLTWPEKLLADEDKQQYLALLGRRISGEPIAYIIGVKEFWSLPFLVSPATLIPRPDTEVLVESVLEQFNGLETLHCLDLGTGTGAIALSLASEQPNWHIDAIDFSLDAVRLAQQNAQNLQLSHVNIFQSDWFSALNDRKYDLIVSNPPYIDKLDENLSQGDVRFEPESALVADEEGLGDIKHIAQRALKHLTPQGALFFEHGFEQGQAVRDILIALGYQGAQTVRDFNGHERITWAKLKSA